MDSPWNQSELTWTTCCSQELVSSMRPGLLFWNSTVKPTSLWESGLWNSITKCGVSFRSVNKCTGSSFPASERQRAAERAVRSATNKGWKQLHRHAIQQRGHPNPSMRISFWGPSKSKHARFYLADPSAEEEPSSLGEWEFQERQNFKD